jgi:hypothetical protein
MILRLFGLDVSAALANHYRQFYFIINLRGNFS